MMKTDRFCQSCGMPMDMDPHHGGTNSDGSKTTKYCSYCYQMGAFKDDFTDAKQMVQFVREKLKEQNHGFLKRWFYTLHIPKLERWRQS